MNLTLVVKNGNRIERECTFAPRIHQPAGPGQ
jgi:hypothetical protein